MTQSLKAPRRTRHDGWTEDRKAVFVAALTRGGSIAAAAASAGMSRRSAYRLRVRPDGAAIADAWSKSAPPPTQSEFDAILDGRFERDHSALEARSSLWLHRQILRRARLSRRRDWAAARRANAGQNTGRRADMCDLHPVAPAQNPGGLATALDRDPAADPLHKSDNPGRRADMCDLYPVAFAKQPVVAPQCVTFAPRAPAPARALPMRGRPEHAMLTLDRAPPPTPPCASANASAVRPSKGRAGLGDI